MGGRSAEEIVHRLAERVPLGGAPRPTREQADIIAEFLAVADEPHAALAAVARLARPRQARLKAVLDAWDRRLPALAAQGVPAERIILSTSFGRPFGYYDGVLFEVRSAALGEDQPVAAGGRYDSLPARLGAPLATGAVGCTVRPGRAWSGGAP